MIYLVSAYWLINPFFLVSKNELVLVVMTLDKLIYYELLHCYNVYYVELSFYVVEDHYAELICYATVAKVGEDEKH